MRGFEWQDQRGVEGTGFVRALRSLLTANLPILLPSLADIIGKGLCSEYETYKRIDGLKPYRALAFVQCSSG